MSFEEIHKIIQEMLAVQRELQNSQLRLQEKYEQQREESQRQLDEIKKLFKRY